jgi:CheY-like chemotaxis protein
MPSSAAVLCREAASLRTLKSTLKKLGVEQVTCRSGDQAMAMIVGGRCSTLIVDFALPGAGEVIKTASLLSASQRPILLAMTEARMATGEAFQSGADRLLYKPLQPAQVEEAFETRGRRKAKQLRKAPRFEMEALVYLDFGSGSVPVIGVDLSEHGFGVRATEAVLVRSNLAFHCLLPGTAHTLRGHADVIWSDDKGRAGLFFSRLAPSARKLLNRWLGHGNAAGKAKDMMRALLPPTHASAHSADLR